jgi:hypothetical protein
LIYESFNPVSEYSIDEDTAPSISLFSVHDSYVDGGISTTYITYFKDILSKLPYNTSYVMFRSSRYEYVMYYGPVGTFTVNDNIISASSCSYVRYSSDTSLWDYGTETDFGYRINGYQAYSSLGEAPYLGSLRGGEERAISAVSVLLALLVGVLFLIRIFR